MTTRACVTGAAGFLGSHVVEHLLKTTDWQLVLLDRLTYASNGLSRLRDIQAFDPSRVQMFPIDIAQGINEMTLREMGHLDYVLHLAAETHVDRSIVDPRSFVIANCLGTLEMLQAARQMSDLRAFVMFSTDEVFGPAPAGVNYKEWDRYNAGNPYSASKAGAEQLALAFSTTYKLPIIITRCMNIFGERQHSEKFIPLTVKKLLKGESLTIHADPSRARAGSRFYIHARNVADALTLIINQHEEQIRCDVFHIVGEREVDNLELATLIHGYLEAALGSVIPFNYQLVDFHSSRPGHDLRYALDGSKLAQAGWAPPKTFEQSLEKTVRWMVDPRNIQWLML